jgi:flagellar motor switch protein FliM
MSLEEQFQESEKSRFEVEERKRRVEAGLPSLEEEAIVNALKEQEALKSMPTLANVVELVKDANVRIEGLNAKLESSSSNQQAEIDTIKQSVKDLSDLVNGDLIPLIKLLQKRSQTYELERETLTLLNQYLKNWL